MQTVKTSRITKPIRHMTVCRYAFRGINSRTNNSFPALRLAGKWLQYSGFKPGHVKAPRTDSYRELAGAIPNQLMNIC